MKILFRSLAFLVIAAAWFVFWGSGPNGDLTYVKIEEGKATSISKGDTITIMTYNIGYLSGMINNSPEIRTQSFFEDNLQAAKEFIANHQPDIIGFQEIDFYANRSFNVNQLAAIADQNQLNYKASAVNWDKAYVPFPYWPINVQFGSIVSGQAIASSFPVLSNERIVLEQPQSEFWLYDLFYIDRLIQVCKLRKGKQVFYVMNVHLEAWDQEVRVRQAEVVKKYFNMLSKQLPVLLIGDFNAQPGSQTYETIMSSDGISAAYLKDPERVANTYPSDKASKKIDYVFYSINSINPVQIISYNQSLNASDHLPVLFQFVLN